MFNAVLAQSYSRPGAPFTKGKSYEVVDFNEYFGTYTIVNDAGDRAAVDWEMFADRGKASDEYIARGRV